MTTRPNNKNANNSAWQLVQTALPHHVRWLFYCAFSFISCGFYAIPRQPLSHARDVWSSRRHSSTTFGHRLFFYCRFFSANFNESVIIVTIILIVVTIACSLKFFSFLIFCKTKFVEHNDATYSIHRFGSISIEIEYCRSYSVQCSSLP